VVTRAAAGRGTSRVTGAVAAAVAGRVLAGGVEVPAGVVQIDQVVGLSDLLSDLTCYGVSLRCPAGLRSCTDRLPA